MDSYFEIAGRKRYPIHNSNQTTKTTDTGNDKVGTTFRPLKDGAIFKGKLRYHNLKKAEIGALLSALTFHNSSKTFHNIGMAKSLGYGKVELKLDGVKDINSYLKEFEKTLTEQIPNWVTSEQLKELVAMATEQKNEGNSKLKYLELTEFAKNKTGNEQDYLRNYTVLDNIKPVTITSLLSDEERKSLISRKEEIAKEREEKARQEAEAKKEKEELEAKIKKEKEDLEKALLSNDMQTIKNFISKYPQNENISQLEALQNTLEEAQKQNKFAEVNQEAQKAWDNIHNPAFKAKLKSGLQNYIKKWADAKNNKGSDFVLELVEKAKVEEKKTK
jgi:hypothetical protein